MKGWNTMDLDEWYSGSGSGFLVLYLFTVYLNVKVILAPVAKACVLYNPPHVIFRSGSQLKVLDPDHYQSTLFNDSLYSSDINTCVK